MHQARFHRPPGRVGLLLPPMPPRETVQRAGDTQGSTGCSTWGTTEWTASLCVEAERLGASAIWASDHLFWHGPAIECMTTLAASAAVTRDAALGTCVLQLPLRSPAAVAKQAASLQLLSGGRFILGVGVGSHHGEYHRAGAEFGCRGRRLDEGITALRAAWATADDPTGRYRMEPGSHVPIWVGGQSPAARRRAATVGDGWVPLFVGPSRFADDLSRLRDEAVAAGREPYDVAAAVVMVACVGAGAGALEAGTTWLSGLYGIPAKAFERHLVAGSATFCAETAARYFDAGAEHVVVMVASDDAIDQFARVIDALGEMARPSGAELAGVGA